MLLLVISSEILFLKNLKTETLLFPPVLIVLPVQQNSNPVSLAIFYDEKLLVLSLNTTNDYSDCYSPFSFSFIVVDGRKLVTFGATYELNLYWKFTENEWGFFFFFTLHQQVGLFLLIFLRGSTYTYNGRHFHIPLKKKKKLCIVQLRDGL